MPNQFVFYGKIVPAKETEKFKPIDRKNFSSGWTNTTCKFNVISGTNRIMCVAQGGKWIDDAKNVIKTTGQAPEGGGKRETVTIAWDKRFDQEQIDKVAGFRHYVVDLEDRNVRNTLNALVKAFKEKKVTDEMIAESGYDTVEKVNEALDKANKRKHVFINAWDFAEYMTKVVVSEKIKNRIFKISGNQEIQYANGRFYTNYVVNRVELMPNAEISANMLVDFYFAEDCVSENDGVGYLNGWSTYFDSGLKKSGFYPVSIAIRNDNDMKLAKKKFVVSESEIACVGLSVAVIDGADRVEITMDDLDDDTREEIEAGWVTFEEVVKAMGGNKIGDRMTELRFIGLNPRKKKVEDTTYSVEDMIPAMNNVDEHEDEDL